MEIKLHKKKQCIMATDTVGDVFIKVVISKQNVTELNDIKPTVSDDWFMLTIYRGNADKVLTDKHIVQQFKFTSTINERLSPRYGLQSALLKATQIGYYDIAMVVNEMLIDLRKVKNMVDKLILNKEPVYRFKMVRKPSNKRLLRIAVLNGINKYHGQLTSHYDEEQQHLNITLVIDLIDKFGNGLNEVHISVEDYGNLEDIQLNLAKSVLTKLKPDSPHYEIATVSLKKFMEPLYDKVTIYKHFN